MTLVYLIRHGRPRTTWGDGDPDPGLDREGRGQALAVAKRFLALPPAERPSRVISSPLRRCLETAAPTADALGLVVEIDPAVGEIPTPADLPAAKRSAWLKTAFEGRWSDIVGDLDYDAWRRNATVAVAGYPGAAVFSHFVAINGVVSSLEGASRVIVFRPNHCSVSRFRIASSGLELLARGAEASTDVL